MMKSIRQGTTTIDSVEFSARGELPISIQDANDWARIESNIQDETVGELLEDVFDEFSRMTNRSLVSQTVTVIFSSYGREIRLPYGKVSSVTSVEYVDRDGKETASEDDYYVVGDTIYFDSLQGTQLKIVYTADGWDKGLRNPIKQSFLTSWNDREDNVLGGVVKIPNNSRKKALRYKRY